MWKKYFSFAKEIIINERNSEENIKYIQNSNLIVGKAQNSDNDDFSILYYVDKTINRIKIPSSIKVISSNSFTNCENLKSVTFENDSNLNTIENCAFEKSAIEELSVPLSVVTFEPKCFIGTDQLINIKIIPCKEQNVIYYNDSILISKSNGDVFDTIHFVRRNLDKITIPSFVKRINSSSFDGCDKIKEIKFDKNSNLEIINESQFNKLNIDHIEIPKKVASIENEAFSNCKSFKFIVFESDSNLNSIGDYAFRESAITSIKIPSSVSKIGLNVFKWCQKIQIIEFGENSKLKSIHKSMFSVENEIVMVPVELSHIVKF